MREFRAPAQHGADAPVALRGLLQGHGELMTAASARALDATIAMIDRGQIVDAKTIMVLQYAALQLVAP